VRADHVIEFDEDVDNDRTGWSCDCGHGGSAPSHLVDVAAERHIHEGESVVYRTRSETP